MNIAPTLRLSISSNRPSFVESFSQRFNRPPAILVSYVYLKGFLERQRSFHYRDWSLDSGAYSMHNAGVTITLQEYIDTAKRLRDNDNTLTEIFALDVIGDWRAGLKNCEEMWRQGIEAIPCFHPGRDEPDDVLKGIARDYPKIAIGGLVAVRGKLKTHLIEQCFARVWPCRIHGFGFGAKRLLMDFPFDSVDASTWEYRPTAFGEWHEFGWMSVRGSNHNLRSEIEWYLNLEDAARVKWKPVWEKFRPPAPRVGAPL